MEIIKPEEVRIRELWAHEQYGFSNWLAKKENIVILNEILGLTLTDIKKEVYVGSYRCDLVAKDESSNTKVIIENQLDPSNHEHLGKIITYASGLDAQVVVWIVKQAKEEHRSAIEWLNNKTDSGINFFLIELHAFTIDKEKAFPILKVVEAPNDFKKNNKINGNSSELTKSQSERLNFWNRFNEILAERDKPFNIRKATTDHWYHIAIGTTAAHISITLVNKENKIGVELTIHDNKELYDNLLQQKDEIENQLGFRLKWKKLDNNKASRIIYYIDGLNFNNNSNYDLLINEAIDKSIALRNVFEKYL